MAAAADRAGGATSGGPIVTVAWASVIVVAVVVGLGVVIDALEGVAVAVCVGCFVASLPVWVYALGTAIARSARGDDIAVASLFFLQGSAPPDVRRHLLGAFGASIVVAAFTAWTNPFVVLVPMLTLGLVGLWGALGTERFPPAGRAHERYCLHGRHRE